MTGNGPRAAEFPVILKQPHDIYIDVHSGNKCYSRAWFETSLCQVFWNIFAQKPILLKRTSCHAVSLSLFGMEWEFWRGGSLADIVLLPPSPSFTVEDLQVECCVPKQIIVTSIAPPESWLRGMPSYQLNFLRPLRRSSKWCSWGCMKLVPAVP